MYVATSATRAGVVKVGFTFRNAALRIHEYCATHKLKDNWELFDAVLCERPDQVEAAFRHIHRDSQATLKGAAEEFYFLGPSDAVSELRRIIDTGVDKLALPDSIKNKSENKTRIDYEKQWRRYQSAFYGARELPASERSVIYSDQGIIVLSAGHEHEFGLTSGRWGIFRYPEANVPNLDRSKESPDNPIYVPLDYFFSHLLIRLVGMGKEVYLT